MLLKKLNNKNVLRYSPLLTLLLLTISLLIYLAFIRNSSKHSGFEIPEPEASLSTETFVGHLEDESSGISLSNSEAIKYSPDLENSFAIIKNENESGLIDNGLYVISQELTTLEVEKNNISNAEFINDKNIYYQKLNVDPGIYFYNLETGEKKLAIETTDLKSFENVVPIDENKYFYIEPKTGKVGFGEIQTGQRSVILQKSLEVKTNYAQSGAYYYAVGSPNKEYVAFFDLTDVAQNKIALLIYPSIATKAEDLYFKAYADISSRSLIPGEKLISWSEDSELVIAGESPVIVHVKEKKIVYEGNTKSKSLMSPDKTSLAYIDFETLDLEVVELGNSENIITLAKYASQFEWMDNEHIFLIIGKKLYIYNLPKQELNLISEERGEYRIVGRNGDRILVSFDGEKVFEVGLGVGQ